MAEPNRQAGEEETVADVSIDSVYYEERQPTIEGSAAPEPPATFDGDFTLSFAQPLNGPEAAQPGSDKRAENPSLRATLTTTTDPEEQPVVRRGANAGTRAGHGKKKRKAIPKRKPDSLPRKILLAPLRLVNKVSAWVMGSGINSRNPLLVTLRMFTVLFPIFISIYLSYLQMAVMNPGAGSIFSDKNETRLVVDDSRNPVVQLGAKRLTIPLPDEFEIMDTAEYYTRFPLTKRVAEQDGFLLTFAARRTDADNSVYYLNVGVTGEHAARNYDEKSFAKMLRDLMRILEAGSMVQNGPNQTDVPFDVTARSACFGRMAAKYEYEGRSRVYKEALRQYSCILYLNGKAVTINVGYAFYTDKGEPGDANWCLQTLQKWRDALLEEYK